MPRARKNAKRDIESYAHADKERVNNPPVGLVTPDTDKDGGKKTYAYDPHLDPQLQWAGKAEHTSFEVPTVSLHVHERIDPRSIIEAVRKQSSADSQLSLFATPKENPPIRQAIEFYKHKHNWTNRLIAGDSLLVMNSLLEKEGMAGKVQMVYIDPPYGITYKSNFQPFVNKRDVTAGKDEDLTQEPETIRAFRDTWELDHNPVVDAWVKNDHLGFEVFYVHRGVVRKYRPDFLIRLKSGDMLVLEVKGKDSDQNRTKRRFLDEWTRAINEHGDFGRWFWDVSKDPGDIKDILARHVRPEAA